MGRSKGMAAAVAAYIAWGPLAPLGALLLAGTGPFTLNALRTAGAIVLFTVFMGPRVLVRALALLRRDARLWLLGVVGLGLTFGAYLSSIRFLEPTIAALINYLSPLGVGVIARKTLGERVSSWFWPTIVLTLIGATIAVVQPLANPVLDRDLGIGVGLGIVGVAGWTFFTVFLKHLGKTYDDRELNLSAFITSGLAFLIAAAVVERLRIAASPGFGLQLAVYVLVPSFASYQLYAIAVRNAGAAVASVLMGIEVVATAVFSFFLTNEPFGLQKTVGILIVLASVTGFLVEEAIHSRRTTPKPEQS